MNDAVGLGERLEAFVEELVADGRFSSRDDALRESVRLLEARERRLASLDEALGQGLADADAGRCKPIDDVFDRLEDIYRRKIAAGP